MRNIAAYLLLQAGGNQSPTAADIKKLLGVVGIETDDARLDALIAELDGKSTAEVRLAVLFSPVLMCLLTSSVAHHPWIEQTCLRMSLARYVRQNF